MRENFDAVPGVGLLPRGYVVFASTASGESYCIDTNVKTQEKCHPVVLFGHEEIDE